MKEGFAHFLKVAEVLALVAVGAYVLDQAFTGTMSPIRSVIGEGRPLNYNYPRL